MSSVTRLRLLSRSMLNVSCQKQKHCSFPPTLTGSSMEFVGQPRPSEARSPGARDSFLGVPGLSSVDMDEDEGDVVIGIRPKSSPLPRRKSSISDEDSEPEPPPSGSRRVSFADAKGLSLVEVKEFDTWDVPKLPGYDLPEGKGADSEEYYLSPLTFSLPLSTEELFAKVLQQKVELEAVELLSGTTILKGLIRVLNISYDKAVYIRTTLDKWSTHFDLLAEYIPGSGDGVTDCFSFKLTLVPPFGEQGARVDFCLRYETPVGTFWANNNDRNYVLFCHHRIKEEKDKPQMENRNKKSCLKTTSQNFSTAEDISLRPALSQENISADESNVGLDVNNTRTKKLPDGQSEASEEQRQKLLMENKQNSSRRRRRKAARMTKVREYFSQRDGGPTDSDGDRTPPEIKQATQEGIPGERHADVQSATEGNSKSECSKFTFEALEICSETHRRDCSCIKEPETPDLVTFARGESAKHIQDMSLHAADDSAEKQNIIQFEDDSQNPDTSCTWTENITPVTTESLVSHTSSFTFGTVVAPLYHQASGRLGSENKNVRDEENPVITGDFKPDSERRHTGYLVSVDPGIKSSNFQDNKMDNLELNHEHSDVTQNNSSSEEEKTSMTVNNVPDCTDNVENPDELGKNSDQSSTNASQSPQALSGETPGCLNLGNVSSNKDLMKPQIPSVSVHLQGDHDFFSQTKAKPMQSQPPEQTCSQTTSNEDENLTRDETQDAVESLQSVSFTEDTDKQSSRRGENSRECTQVNAGCDPGKTAAISENRTSLKEEVTDELNQADDSDTKSSEPERLDIVTPETSLETQGGKRNVGGEIKVTCEVSKATTKEIMRNLHCQGDMYEWLQDEHTLEEMDHRMIEAAVSNQDEDLCLADIHDMKNWEMMVEEEENDILTNEEESDLITSKKEDTGVDTKDATQGGKEIEDIVEEMIAAVVKEAKVDDTVELEEKEWTMKEETIETVAPKDTQFEYLQVRESENAVKADNVGVEKTKGPEETELYEEKQVSTERLSVQDEQRREQEEKIRADLNYEHETCMERENQTEGKDENKEEQDSDHTEEILVVEAGDAESLDAASCMAVDDRDDLSDLKERPDVAHLVKYGLSAPVGEKEMRDGQNVCIQTNNLYKEDGFQIYKDATCDQTKSDSECPASDGDGCHDSASAESDSDDEVALHMRCLRASSASAQAQKDRNKEAAFTAGKRPAISRSRPPLAPMPSITESLDEEQHVRSPQESSSSIKTPAMGAPSASSGQEHFSQSVSWWKNTFSCSNIMKTLLYTTFLVAFLVVSYHYDFLACFGLYLASLVWLCCQGEKQPVKNDNKAATEK